MHRTIKGTTMCVELVSGVLLVVHATVNPSRVDWSDYCDLAGEARRSAEGALRTLVLTALDSGPNAQQRAEYKERVAGAGNRVAVVCEGNATRAILTAMSWFNPDMKPFRAGQIELALEYLGAKLSPELLDAIEQAEVHLRLDKRRHTA